MAEIKNLGELAKSFAVKRLPDSEVEITGEVPFDVVAPYREHALVEIAESLELPGFRKGKVPTDMALKKVGEMAVLEEAVEHVMRDLYPEIVEAHKLDVVARPDIRVTKLAPNNPIALTILTALYPEVTLPKNYKKIGESITLETALPATDEELNQTLEQLRQSRKTKKEDGSEVVPELTDEFAKSIGAFENLNALKTQIKKGITEEKQRAAKDARRGKIVEALLEKTDAEIPKVFIESELDKIINQMREDVSRFGLTLEGYLTQTKKTEEQVRGEFRDQAKKRAKLQLALNKIAAEEKVEANKEEIETEMKHALEHFPDARPELVRIHIETVMRNEKTLQLLEGTETK